VFCYQKPLKPAKGHNNLLQDGKKTFRTVKSLTGKPETEQDDQNFNSGGKKSYSNAQKDNRTTKSLTGRRKTQQGE